jgi:hypothetical protein
MKIGYGQILVSGYGYFIYQLFFKSVLKKVIFYFNGFRLNTPSGLCAPSVDATCNLTNKVGQLAINGKFYSLTAAAPAFKKSGNVGFFFKLVLHQYLVL